MKSRSRVIAILLVPPLSIWVVHALFEFFVSREEWTAEVWQELAVMLTAGILFGTVAARVLAKGYQAQEALRQSEERFRSVAESANDAIISIDSRGNIVFWNHAAETIFGYLAEEAVGKLLTFIMPERFRKDHQGGMERVVSTGKSNVIGKVVEMYGLKKDGGEFPMELSLASWKAGEEIFFTSTIKDITERKQAEEALRVSEESFRNLVENAPIGIGITSMSGHASVRNRALQEMYGYESREELMKAPTTELYYDPEDRKRFMSLLEKGPVKDFETRFKRKDGTVYWVSMSSIPSISDSEEREIITVVKDITERKQAEEELKKHHEHVEELVEERTRELRDAQEQMVRQERLATLGEFSGSISHEIRNPLGVIDSSVYYLKTKLKGTDEKVQEHLDRIKSSVGKTTTIVESLLNLTRMKEPRLGGLDLIAATREAIATSKVPATVSVVKEVPEQELLVNADWEQLRMALTNIVKNSVEAMDRKGTLTVTVRRTADGQAEASFADTGPGIPAENLDRVFQPLFSTKANGIGFGLSITKMVIDKHGGTIKAKSEPGKGTVITISLPLYAGKDKEA